MNENQIIFKKNISKKPNQPREIIKLSNIKKTILFGSDFRKVKKGMRINNNNFAKY